MLNWNQNAELERSAPLKPRSTDFETWYRLDPFIWRFYFIYWKSLYTPQILVIYSALFREKIT